MSDGVIVPFAVAAGVSGAVGSTHLVVMAGLAEVAAGSIAISGSADRRNVRWLRAPTSSWP